MALPININELITGQTVEWARIEFKKDWNPLPIMRTVCAFANDFDNWGSGYIIIGVSDENGVPVLPPEGINLREIDSIQQNLVNVCSKLNPDYLPIFEPENYQGKKILVIWVPGGSNRPYRAPETLSKGAKYEPYIRKGSITKKANYQEEKELISMAENIPFDDQINHHAKLTDLNVTLIQSHLSEIQSALSSEVQQLNFVELCRKMNVAEGSDEYFKPKNVGLLFFNLHPKGFFSAAQIEIVEFKDEIGDTLKEKVFVGPIQNQIRDALIYLNNYVISEFIHKVPNKAEAIRFYNYPYEALEESLVNAVYHQSYQDDSPIEIRAFQNRIEILSYPGPLPPLNKENIMKGNVSARKYRNRRIGDFLKELHLTEGRGTGFPKIRKAMETNGSPNPIFETDDKRTYFLTLLKIHPKFQLDKSLKLHPKFQLDKSRTILNACKKPHKRAEIFELLELSNQTKNFNSHILPLIEAGYLTYTIPDKPNSKNQQYRTTSIGLEFINTIENIQR